MDNRQVTSERERRLLEVLAACEEAVDAGGSPEAGEWIARHPDLAEELARFFADRAAVVPEMARWRGATQWWGAAETPPPSAPQAVTLSGAPGSLANHSRYRLLEKLGEGGMGTVWKARHLLLDRTVALKVINPALLASPGAVERFLQEMKAAGRLDHPNIVKAFDAEQAGDACFFVMEHLDGVDLARLVHERGPLPVHEACSYAGQAALGLQHASEQGMVHRDIKPHNLIATSGGVVKVLDFGLARFTRESGSSHTAAGVVLGTPAYMAPEQAADPRSADIRADLYSLGCTLYFLLSGRPPFAGDSPLELLRAHREDTPRPVSARRADVPAELEGVLSRLLAKDPAARYATPRALADALRPFTRPSVRPARTVRSRRPLLFGLAAVLLLAAGALCWRWWPGGKPPDRQPGQESAGQGDPLPGAGLGEKGPGEKRPPGEEPGLLRTFSGHSHEVACAALSPDGRSILSGCFTELWLWDVERPAKPRALPGFHGLIHGVAISRDGKHGLSAGQGGHVILWDLPAGKEITRLSEGNFKHPRNVVFSPDGKHFLYSIPQGASWLCCLEPFEKVASFPDDLACFSPDGKHVYTVPTIRTGPTLSRWEALTGKPAGRWNLPGVIATCLAVSPDGKLALVGNQGKRTKEVLVFDPAKGEEVGSLKGHEGQIFAAVFLPDGKRALTGSRDGTIRLWEVPAGKEILRFTDHTGAVSTVVLSADGRLALSASEDKTVRLWRLPD
jgi:hypothetical protein